VAKGLSRPESAGVKAFRRAKHEAKIVQGGGPWDSSPAGPGSGAPARRTAAGRAVGAPGEHRAQRGTVFQGKNGGRGQGGTFGQGAELQNTTASQRAEGREVWALGEARPPVSHRVVVPKETRGACRRGPGVDRAPGGRWGGSGLRGNKAGRAVFFRPNRKGAGGGPGTPRAGGGRGQKPPASRSKGGRVKGPNGPAGPVRAMPGSGRGRAGRGGLCAGRAGGRGGKN